MTYTNAPVAKRNDLVCAVAILTSTSVVGMGGFVVRAPIAEYSVAAFRTGNPVSVVKASKRSSLSKRMQSKSAEIARLRREKFNPLAEDNNPSREDFSKLIEDAQAAVIRNSA